MAYTVSGFKKFTPIHDKQATEMNRCLPEADIPEWMSTLMTTLNGKTIMIQKDPNKEPSKHL